MSALSVNHGRFLGAIECSVDEKSRWLTPTRVRNHFASGGYLALLSEPFVHVAVFSEERWEQVLGRFREAHAAGIITADALYRLTVGSFGFEPDANGRVTLPAALKEHAGLDGKIMVVGLDDHLGLTTPAAYGEFLFPSADDDRGRADARTVAEILAGADLSLLASAGTHGAGTDEESAGGGSG